MQDGDSNDNEDGMDRSMERWMEEHCDERRSDMHLAVLDELFRGTLDEDCRDRSDEAVATIQDSDRILLERSTRHNHRMERSKSLPPAWD